MADARQGVPTNGPGDWPQLTELTASLPSGPVALQVAFQAIVEGGSVFGPYRWEFGDGNAARIATPSTSPTCQSPGANTATVTADVPPGCPATPATATVTAAPAGSA